MGVYLYPACTAMYLIPVPRCSASSAQPDSPRSHIIIRPIRACPEPALKSKDDTCSCFLL